MRVIDISMFTIVGIVILGFPLCADAANCLTIENVKGQSASSNRNYEMGKDGFSSTLKFCFEGDEGAFDGNTGVFRRFGPATFVWFDTIGETVVVEVWTFDLANRKALFSRTRGTGSLLPATVGAFVGDITATEIE